MFLYCNCEWLLPEINDVIRLFGAEDEPFGHKFEYYNGDYYNFIEYGGEIYDSKFHMDTQDELEFKRYAKRFAKLSFYNLLSDKKGVKMPYGALTGIRHQTCLYRKPRG